jgi:signal transduction histidine kinase
MLIRMKDTAEGLLGAQNIEFEFVESGLDSAGRLSPTVRENLYLILKEAVHNAVKHSRATKVRVSVQGEGKGMVMSIEDNGKGIDPDPGRKGNGLRNMAMRAERIGATFTLTGPPGTTIIIRKRLL